jgi:hypothetical protein
MLTVELPERAARPSVTLMVLEWRRCPAALPRSIKTVKAMAPGFTAAWRERPGFS